MVSHAFADELWQHLSQVGVEKEPQPGYDRDDQASTFSNKDGAAGVLAHMERCRCGCSITLFISALADQGGKAGVDPQPRECCG
jgi:hypothetical protein